MNLKSFSPENLTHRCRRVLDNIRGLDFLMHINPEDVGLDPNVSSQSSPSGAKYLKNVLLDFNISSEDSIIDIGCGKGQAMRTMLKFPFSRVDGLELSCHIANIAIRNFKRLDADCTIFVCDASSFSLYDAYNIIYLYNPFPGCVMSKTIDSLIQSIHRLDRELVIIYNNAICHDVVVSQGIFKKIGIYPGDYGNEMVIYSNRSYSNSRLSSNMAMQIIST